MDPICNIKEQLELAHLIQSAYDDGIAPYEPTVIRLAELVIALDQWMRKGGFSPWS